MSRLDVDVRSASAFAKDPHDTDADNVDLASSEWQERRNPFIQDKHLQSVLGKERKTSDGLNRVPSIPSALNYTFGKTSDLAGKIHQGLNSEELLELNYSNTKEYTWRDQDCGIPRTVPDTLGEYKNTYRDLGREFSKGLECSDGLHGSVPPEEEVGKQYDVDTFKDLSISEQQPKESYVPAEFETNRTIDSQSNNLSSKITWLHNGFRGSCRELSNPDGLKSKPVEVASIFDKTNGSSSGLLVSEMTTNDKETNLVNSFKNDVTAASNTDGNSARKDDLTNKATDHISDLFDSWLRCLPVSQHTGGPQSSTSSNSRDLTSTTPDTSTTGADKGQSSKENGNDSDRSRRGGKDGKKQSRASKTATKSGKRWACPFHQRDPTYYCRLRKFGDYRHCMPKDGFGEVHRVKEHLKEHHKAIYCPRCYYQFESDTELELHHQAASQCEPRSPQPLDGLSKQDQDRLGKRDKKHRLGEERWRAIYTIIFPDDTNIPSPYYRYRSELELFEQDEILAIVEQTLPIDNPSTQHFLHQLKSAYDGRAQGVSWRMPKSLPGMSSNNAINLSVTVPNDNQPTWQDFGLHDGNLRGIQGNGPDEFGTTDASSNTMNMDSYLSPHDPISWRDFEHEINYDATYPA